MTPGSLGLRYQRRILNSVDATPKPEDQTASLPPLPATLAPFDWLVSPSGDDPDHWPLGWELVRAQFVRLAADGIVPQDRYEQEGSQWAPAVDLGLSDPSSFTWFEKGVYVPARQVQSIAAAGVSACLRRGTVLRLEAVCEDRYWEGMGTNFWSVEGLGLGVQFVHSALEGRWGGAAVLADGLIVPVTHSIIGDDDRGDRLVRDLQDITRTFRAAHGLPTDGRVTAARP